MTQHVEIKNKELWKKIKHKEINFGGNYSHKIYGKLNCRSGKRMKKQNRVFFGSEKAAIEKGVSSLWKLYAGRIQKI